MSRWLQRSRALAIACLLLTDQGTLLAHQDKSAEPPAAASVLPVTPGWSLIADNGERVRDTDFRGQWLLVFFGYTACPDVCPLTLARIGTAMRLLGEHAAAVRPMMVTVDPATDTPPVLAAYVSRFHPRLMGLTGSAGEIERVQQLFGAYSRRIDDAGTGPAGVDHTSLIYLFNPEGGLEAQFPETIPPGGLAESILDYF
jgi:protein SCO1/2